MPAAITRSCAGRRNLEIQGGGIPYKLMCGKYYRVTGET